MGGAGCGGEGGRDEGTRTRQMIHTYCGSVESGERRGLITITNLTKIWPEAEVERRGMEWPLPLIVFISFFIVILTLIAQGKRITKPEGRRRAAARNNFVGSKNKSLGTFADSQDTNAVVKIADERFKVVGQSKSQKVESQKKIGER